jgi:signal peptidase I
MENTLHNGDMLLLYSLNYEPEQNDIVVFHLTEHTGAETLVKRVIATGGQELVIDFKKCEIYVDGVLYEDSHATLKDRITDRDIGFYTLFADHDYDRATQTMTTTVPDGCVFVMGDNRNNSKDSRLTEIGFVDERCILGKAIYRLSPFTKFD